VKRALKEVQLCIIGPTKESRVHHLASKIYLFFNLLYLYENKITLFILLLRDKLEDT
jgi:hypothetical protein